MEFEKYVKKRQIFFVINTIIAIAIMVVSGLNIYVISQSENDTAGIVFGYISCVFGLMVLILGALLPKKEKAVYMSDGIKVTASALNLLLNDHITSPSIMGHKPLYRSWNFPGMVIPSIFNIIFCGMGIFIAIINDYSPVTNIAMVALWVLLDICAAFWTYYDVIYTDISEGSSKTPKECGKRGLRMIGKTLLILVVVLVVVGVVAHIRTMKDHKPPVDTKGIQQQMESVKEKVDNLNPDDFFPREEYASAADAVMGLKANYGTHKYYYILQYGEDNTLNIISWTDTSDKIYIDCYDCNEDGSVVRGKSFVSSSLTKADVEGKEDGFVE